MRSVVAVVARWCAVLALALALPSVARAQYYYRPVPDDYYRGPRLRLHTEGELAASGGHETGIGAGVTIGAGVQVNDIVASYIQHRVIVGYTFEGSAAALHSYNSFLLDITVFEWAQLGVGPSLDVGVGALCPADAQGVCDGLGDASFGFDVRLAFVVIHERSRARRRGLAIALHVHPTWLDRDHSVITTTLGAGYTLY